MTRWLKWTALALLFGCAAVPCPENAVGEYVPGLTEIEEAIYHYSDAYQIPSSLLFGIRYAESLNGRWKWSNSAEVVSNQLWAREYKHTARLKEIYGDDIYACVGEFQVLFLTAHSKGYRGSPYDLKKNDWTNTKYACEVLKPYLRRHGHKVQRAIASYNLGHVRRRKDGRFVNYRYVERVWTIYTNGGVR